MKWKVTEAQKKEMIALRKKGVFIRVIAKKFGYSCSTVAYWTDEQFRMCRKANSRAAAKVRWDNKQSHTQLYPKETKARMKKYCADRYKSDAEFRNRIKDAATKWQRENKEAVRKYQKRKYNDPEWRERKLQYRKDLREKRKLEADLK